MLLQPGCAESAFGFDLGPTRIWSPARRLASPQVDATRFSPSVVPRVKITSSGSGAPMNEATVARASSSAVCARRARVWRAAPALALIVP